MPPKLQIVCVLDKLNKAKTVYGSPGVSETQRQEADSTFADCFDWLVNNGVPFGYDAHIDLWLFSGGSTVYYY